MKQAHIWNNDDWIVFRQLSNTQEAYNKYRNATGKNLTKEANKHAVRRISKHFPRGKRQ